MSSNDKIIISFSLPFGAIKGSQAIMKTPKIKLATKKKTSKGAILLKSPCNKFKRRIKQMESEWESDNNHKELSQIDERLSENYSQPKSKGSGISNVRESIMNFENNSKYKEFRSPSNKFCSDSIKSPTKNSIKKRVKNNSRKLTMQENEEWKGKRNNYLLQENLYWQMIIS